MSGFGPLDGVRILEFAGIGPGPYAAMLLADLGADIVRIDRARGSEWPSFPILSRNRTSILLDLKSAEGRATCLAAFEKADVVVEGFRSGVMERLGLGQGEALARNPALVYGRVTGWGQTGPLAEIAGHDINYVALAGALTSLGKASEPPVPPLNLFGDYAAGSLFLVVGILGALIERGRSGLGQVIDATMVDGAASMIGPLLGMPASAVIDMDRNANFLGGNAAPFYRAYRCADDLYVAVGAIEARFRALLCAGLGLEMDALGDMDDPEQWSSISAELERIFDAR